jgi:hypothetical protein
MEKLTESEWRQMLSLLCRYGMEMDQWDMFQVPAEPGPVYVSISLAPVSGAAESNYRVVDPASGRQLRK